MPRLDLAAAASALLLIDVQERFLKAVPAIAADQPCGRNCRILLQAAGLLNIPRLISEQYPAGLGPTLPHLVEAAPEVPRLGKMHFSCAEDPALAAAIDRLGRRQIVLAGIEAHVCVLTTAADLSARGYQVVIAGDATASRDPTHVPMALAAARDLGVLILPSETIVMRWQRQAGVGQFKEMAKLIR
ncbi:MAG: isochorismatase family protein [Planctomycetes bacterium]|jgi:nicotinamidase-related amidase|nr:isochorismatase family protein [Planctomycetota bacterium]